MKQIEVIGLGALNIDHLYKVECILDDGESVVKEAKSFPGGSAANTIYGLAKLGINTGFSGGVGDDPEGKLLIQDFQKVGVDVSQIRVKPKSKSGSVLCLSDQLGHRSLYVAPGANNLLTVEDLELTYMNQAKTLHISSFADDRQFRVLLKLIDSLGSSVKVSFAPGAIFATKGLKALSSILEKTHVLFINQNELQQLTGKDIIDGTETCLRQGCQIIAVTLGKGAKLRNVTAVGYIRDAENEYAIESNQSLSLPEVDTTGAGDAFTAGFLYGLLKKKSLEECGYLGDITAQFCIAKTGARQGLPTLDKLSKRYQQIYGTTI